MHRLIDLSHAGVAADNVKPVGMLKYGVGRSVPACWAINVTNTTLTDGPRSWLSRLSRLKSNVLIYECFKNHYMACWHNLPLFILSPLKPQKKH